MSLAMLDPLNNTAKKSKKGKALPVTGRGGPLDCEASKLPHFLDNRLTDDGEVVSLTCRPHFSPQEDSWYSFLLEAETSLSGKYYYKDHFVMFPILLMLSLSFMIISSVQQFVLGHSVCPSFRLKYQLLHQTASVI
jgi:hypothetical protein